MISDNLLVEITEFNEKLKPKSSRDVGISGEPSQREAYLETDQPLMTEPLENTLQRKVTLNQAECEDNDFEK